MGFIHEDLKGLETMSTTRKCKSADRLQTIQREMETAMLGIILRDRIRTEAVRRRSEVPDVLGIEMWLKCEGLVIKQARF